MNSGLHFTRILKKRRVFGQITVINLAFSDNYRCCDKFDDLTNFNPILSHIFATTVGADFQKVCDHVCLFPIILHTETAFTNAVILARYIYNFIWSFDASHEKGSYLQRNSHVFISDHVCWHFSLILLASYSVGYLTQCKWRHVTLRGVELKKRWLGSSLFSPAPTLSRLQKSLDWNLLCPVGRLEYTFSHRIQPLDIPPAREKAKRF